MNSSKATKDFLLFYFEPEEIEVWTDPYNSIPLKLLTIIIYVIELWASTIMLIFVSYETQGLFGHYRIGMSTGYPGPGISREIPGSKNPGTKKSWDFGS